MSEKFKVSDLRDEVSMYDEFVEIPVTSQGKEYIVKMYPYFLPEKIRDLVDELVEFIKKCKEENLTIPQREEDDLKGYFIIKYFTDMIFTDSPLAKDIYDEFKIALNSSLFSTLMKSYPKESIYAVYERINEVIQASAEIETMLMNAQKAIQELNLQNKDILLGQKEEKPKSKKRGRPKKNGN